MIEIRCCHNLATAAPLREAMNALNLASERPDPFSTFEFYEHYLRHAGWEPGTKGPQLWLLLAFRGGELVGYAALKRSLLRILGLRTARLDWLTAHGADRPHLVSKPDDAERVGTALYGYLQRREKEWSLLEFQQQEPASPLSRPPAIANWQLRYWPNLPNGTIPIRWNSTAAYFAELSGKARSNVSRQARNLMAAGTVQVLTSSDPRSLPALFELYRSIEPHSWKARAGVVIGADRQSVAYYAGLMEPGQPMRVVVQILLLDGRPIAGLICGTFDRGLYALHTVYDEREARLAPGSASMLLGVRLAIEGRYRFLNLLRGSGYYKERWLAEMRDTYSLQIYRRHTLPYWKRMAGDAVRRWLRRPAEPAAVAFNPARRDPGSPVTDTSAPAPDPAGDARHAALVRQALQGEAEFLSAMQFAAMLPFETRRRPGGIAATAE